MKAEIQGLIRRIDSLEEEIFTKQEELKEVEKDLYNRRKDCEHAETSSDNGIVECGDCGIVMSEEKFAMLKKKKE